MKKLILCLMVSFSSASNFNIVKADDVVRIPADAMERQMGAVYDALSGDECGKPTFDVFKSAYTGYLNLLQAGKLNTDKSVLTICDMSMSSNATRMWVIDLKQRKILLNTYVAHGQGSGDEFATAFSNKMNSHQSSIGFYVTGGTYNGEHGRSLYLHGMDKGYNHLAYERNIVVHGADYVNKNFISQHKRLGRSWGCPAVSDKISDDVIDMIKDGTTLFVYYPQKQYLATAVWLNKKVDAFSSDPFANWQPAAAAVKPQAKIVYELGPTGKAVAGVVSKIKFPLY